MNDIRFDGVKKAPILVAVLLLAACVTIEENPDEPFTRSSRLIEAIDRAGEADEVGRVVNLVSYGFETGLLDRGEAIGYFDRTVTTFRERYDRGIAERDFRSAIRAEQNLRVLAENRIDSASIVPLDGLRSRDDLLFEWSQAELARGEVVLGLYLMLRRSTLGDLRGQVLRDYIDIARELNHDEALRRLLRVAEQRGLDVAPPGGALDTPADRPSDMLAGTVTIWVNRGIRIQSGVGVPDRVIGSGFFVDPRGYLITNYHVISSEVDPEYEGFSRLFIKLPGRPDERVPARVIGYDRIFDLALLKVEIDPAYVFSLSDTRELEPGEAVLALGSPGGLDSTITSGIVSASGRRFLQMGEAVQVDVPINPGNSGGPLILPDGQVAGIVFAGIEQFEGVNFAIPSYWVRHFFPRLYEPGEVVHAWLGAAVQPTSDGLEVVYVAPGSPAADVGVGAGDILVELMGTRVSDIASAQDILLSLEPDHIVDSVWRAQGAAGPSLDTTRRLIALAERPFSPVEDALEQQPIESLFPVLFGMNVDQVSGAPWGPDYIITEVLPGSIADESSLSVDDPFALRNWRVDRDLRAAFIQIIIRRRKAGFLESGVQLGAYLETDRFI